MAKSKVKQKVDMEPPDMEPKGQHGGARPGAGRKPTLGSAMTAGIYLRCSADQKAALLEYVKGIEPRVELSTWIRELALKHSGNSDLGMAAAAREKAHDVDAMFED